jgi:hypothetical protein
MTDQAETIVPSEDAREIWYRAWLVLNELLAHTSVMVTVIPTMEGLQLLLKFCNHGEDLIFFDGTPFRYPVKWLFHAADTAMILAILYRGVLSAHKTYKGAKR